MGATVSHGVNNKAAYKIFAQTDYGRQYCKYLEDGIAKLSNGKFNFNKPPPKNPLCEYIIDWIWAMDKHDKQIINTLPVLVSNKLDLDLNQLGIKQLDICKGDNIPPSCIIAKIITFGMTSGRGDDGIDGGDDGIDGGDFNLENFTNTILNIKLINIILIVIIIILIYIICFKCSEGFDNKVAAEVYQHELNKLRYATTFTPSTDSRIPERYALIENMRRITGLGTF